MKLTIIETGLPPEAIRDRYEGYPAMFAELISRADPDMTFKTVSPVKGEALPDPASLEAILITGSAYGVYDDVPWMTDLKDWIGFAAEHEVPMIGICFGHQVIADALGGDVRKSDKGWGIGRHTYRLQKTPHWMTNTPEQFSVGVSHQDQVLSPPADADVLAGNEFCPHAGLLYNRAPILSFQGHPEFSDTFMGDLYEARKGRPLTEAQVDKAIASFKTPHDNDLMGRWMVEFLKADRS